MVERVSACRVTAADLTHRLCNDCLAEALKDEFVRQHITTKPLGPLTGV